MALVLLALWRSENECRSGSGTLYELRKVKELKVMANVYECGHEMGSCTCYDCAVVGCDNYKDKETDTYCPEHAVQELDTENTQQAA